jgi:hypothetical protein
MMKNTLKELATSDKGGIKDDVAKQIPNLGNNDGPSVASTALGLIHEW